MAQIAYALGVLVWATRPKLPVLIADTPVPLFETARTPVPQSELPNTPHADAPFANPATPTPSVTPCPEIADVDGGPPVCATSSVAELLAAGPCTCSGAAGASVPIPTLPLK